MQTNVESGVSASRMIEVEEKLWQIDVDFAIVEEERFDVVIEEARRFIVDRRVDHRHRWHAL